MFQRRSDQSSYTEAALNLAVTTTIWEVQGATEIYAGDERLQELSQSRIRSLVERSRTCTRMSQRLSRTSVSTWTPC